MKGVKIDMKKANLISGTTVIIFSAIIFAAAISIPLSGEGDFQAANFPMILAVLAVVLSLYVIFSRKESLACKLVAIPENKKDLLTAGADMVLTGILLPYIGFLPSAVIFLYVFIRIFRTKRLYAIIFSIAIGASVFLLFQYGLRVQLPEGRLLRFIN